jgi:hypothetical protein
MEVPFHGSDWESTIQKLFPADVREKIDGYFSSLSSNFGKAEELRKHLLYRQTHPEVPPLTILSALPTPTPTPVIIAPTPFSTQTIIPAAITADPIQIERWKEYENALAKALFPSSFIPDEFLCEWEILGRSDQEVYMWTVCMSIFPVESTGLPYHGEMPAAIHIEADGSVQSVEIPGGGTHYAADIRRMFPAYAAEKYFDWLIHAQELTDHLNWRREHPEEPPLIVLSTTPTP